MDVEYTWEIEGQVDRPVAGGRVPDAPAGRRWPYFLVMLRVLAATLTVAAGFWLAWDQVRALQVQAETAAMREAESSFALAFAAIEEADEEVFRLILPGNDLTWTAAQRRLFQESALFDRASFGLLLAGTAQKIVDTELSPDLTQATVLAEQEYGIAQAAEPAGAQPAMPVTLQFTTLLQKENGQWAWQEPDEAFWGGWAQIETGRVRITYPQRDAEIVRRLADDLDEEVNQLCDQFALVYCPEGVVLTLWLDVDPAVLVAMAKGPPPRGEEGEFFLPTPTLMGLPVDEAGYRAVRRGYAAQAAAAMIKNIIGWECGDPLTLYLAAQEDRLIC